jgi:hypothetical protein
MLLLLKIRTSSPLCARVETGKADEEREERTTIRKVYRYTYASEGLLPYKPRVISILAQLSRVSASRQGKALNSALAPGKKKKNIKKNIK